MGKIISRVAKGFLQKFQWRILMVGLDSSGKTTILYRLKMGETVRTIPTIGFNVESIEYKNVRFTIWDVGGQNKIRSLWRHYFQNTNGVVFVVDSNDRQRISEARNELHNLLSDDLPTAMSVKEVADKLALHSLGNRSWYIQSTSAISGQGLYQGLDWLLNNIS